MISDDLSDAELYLTVRTTSWEFNGERTDLHDVFSLLWAAALRASEAASGRLVTVLNGFSGIESEIYARHILLNQQGTLRDNFSLRDRAEALSTESLNMGSLLIKAFGRPDGINLPLEHVTLPSPEPEWIGRVRERLRLAEFEDYEVRQRPYPRWTYFGSNDRGVSLIEISAQAAMALRDAFATFQPASISGVDGKLFRSDRLLNAASSGALDELTWLLAQVDGFVSTPMIIPIDSHLIGIGNCSLAAIRTWCGRESFDIAHDELDSRRAEEASFLKGDHVCRWAELMNDDRFESFVQDLLLVERGVHRVRQVGASREPDDGRDFLVEWSTPPDRSGNAWREKTGLDVSVQREIIVQVKLRRKTGVGRADLPGLRDTLEHHRCDGLLVVAYPRITANLMEHLNELRRKGTWWIDWWGRSELETRIRRHPEIADRYPDIVKLERPMKQGKD
ncbi:restriction endonuclease [Bradyrhizobium liaoningense]|uniref:restriction endonuclease n=1 Tax=Bradyrhizobium liaoningense TaxID=43992 RepID=UPI0012FDF7D8|nr:restriction endonuclease [Bradyrhizobium liaoningense]